MSASSGYFITLEGIDGSGKSLQAEMLCAELRRSGHDVVNTLEPGGTDLGRNIRSMLLDRSNNRMCYKAEALLFNAARAQLMHEVIIPAILSRKIVVCDRFADSTLAYQGFGRNQNMADLEAIIEIATNGTVPDLTLLLDVDTDSIKSRFNNDKLDRIEQEGMEFQNQVREGYLKLAALDPRWRIINAVQSVTDVHIQIMTNVWHVIKGGSR